jgi:hypothetical protein
MRVSQQYADEWLESHIRYDQDVGQNGSAYLEVLQKYSGKKPQCENCGRETEVLFDGFKLPDQDNAELQRSIAKLTKKKRCRPPSNLEIEEMLSAGNRPC